MSKLKKLAQALKTAQETVSLLESAGIDVDRLIGISNAQGPLAKLLHGVLNGSIDLNHDAAQHFDLAPDLQNGRKLLQGKKSKPRSKRSTSKRRPASTGP